METFVYAYRSTEGKVVSGKIKALDINQARNFFKRKHITLSSIKSEKLSLWQTLVKERSVPDDDIVGFSQLFGSCIKSGLTVKDSLSLLSKQVENKLLMSCLEDILVSVESGQSLSVAFSNHPNVFPPFYPMLLKAGEASGKLGETLDYISQYLERINTLRKEVVGIFLYPLVVSVVGIGMLIIILIFVAPNFTRVFAQAKVALPLPTRILFFLSSLFSKYALVMATLIAAMSGLWMYYYRTEKGKFHVHMLILKTPLVGKLVKQALMLRFLKGFDILVNNKVPLLETLKVLEDGTTNLCLKKIIVEMRRDASRGLSISGPLVDNKHVVSPLISYSVSMAEKAGTLGETVNRLGQFVDREITFSMKRLSAKLDPILTAALGLMVLFIALAIYLPIFDMMKVTQQ
jgi:type II secretory pathway component PulF